MITANRQPKIFIRHKPVRARGMQVDLEVFQKIADHAQDILFRFRLSPQKRVEYVSPAVLTVLGYSPDDFIQDPNLINKITHPDDQVLLKDIVRGEVDDEACVLRFFHRCGQIVWTEQHLHYDRDLQGRPLAVQGIARNISAKMVAEKALLESEKKLRNVIEQSSEGIVLTNEQGIVIEWNQSMEEITCIPREAILGRPAWEVQLEILGFPRDKTPEKLTRYKATILNALKTGQAPQFGIEFHRELLRKDGEHRFIETLSYPIKTEKGYMIGIILRDITERKLAEKAEQEQRDLAEGLRATAEALTSSTNMDEVLDCLLVNLEKVVPHDSANVMLVENGVVRIVRAHNYEKILADPDAIFQRTWLIDDMPTFKEAASLHRPLLIADTEHCPNWKKFPSSEWVRSIILAPIEMEGRLLGFINVHSKTPLFFNQYHASHLQIFAYQAAIAVNNALMFANLRGSHQDLEQAYEATIEGWAFALDLRDHETQGHTMRVTEWTMRLARALNLPEDELVHIRRGAILHDIGKMGIPDSVLLKPGPLDHYEQVIMQMHTEFARQMLIKIDYLRPAMDIPYAHHEKWDGTGYPRGLKGEEIPLAARIFALADVWDALTSDRPYRMAWGKEEAVAYIQSQAGKHFDPKLVNVFLTLVNKFEQEK